MKKIACLGFCFLGTFLLLTRLLTLTSLIRVYADFNQAYQDYLYQYDQYRAHLTDFLTAKNRYLSYQTLTSQNDALSAGKTFLDARSQTIIAYLRMLPEKNSDETFKKSVEDEIAFYADFKDKIFSPSSLDDAEKVSSEIEDHFSQTEILARRITASLFLNRLKVLEKRQESLEEEFKAEINSLRAQGKDITTIDRWLLSAYNKRLLALEKTNQAEDSANTLTSSRNSLQEFKKVQSLLFEANQYLKEGTSYLKEIKEEIKYGNY